MPKVRLNSIPIRLQMKNVSHIRTEMKLPLCVHLKPLNKGQMLTQLLQREQCLLRLSHARPLREKRMCLTPVHMWAEREDTQMRSARTQHLKS